jgi:hypothetical protein
MSTNEGENIEPLKEQPPEVDPNVEKVKLEMLK